MVEVTKYIKEQVEKQYASLQGFQIRLNTDLPRMRELQEQIARHKADKGDDYEEVRDKILELINIHYTMTIIHQERRSRILVMHELAMMVQALGLDLGLDGEVQEALTASLLEALYIIEADSSGTVKPVVGPVGDVFKDGLDKVLEDEDYIKNTYDSFDVAKA